MRIREAKREWEETNAAYEDRRKDCETFLRVRALIQPLQRRISHVIFVFAHMCRFGKHQE